MKQGNGRLMRLLVQQRMYPEIKGMAEGITRFRLRSLLLMVEFSLLLT